MEHLKSYATNTRLMGVVVVKSYFSDEDDNKYLVLVHLDFETDGIDGIDIGMNINHITENYLSERAYGGLGGKLIEISFDEACSIVMSAREKGIVNVDEEDLYWIDIYSDASISYEKSIKKICKAINSDYELINYYFMRLVGNDVLGLNVLSDEEIIYSYIEDTTLIKNSINSLGEGNYISTTLILSDSGYMNERYHLKVSDKKVVELKRISKLKISHYEAAMQLSKDEYLTVLEVRNAPNVISTIAETIGHYMINEHENGVLATHFYEHNNHVDKEVYYLNGDVKAHVYFTKSEQIVFASENIDELEKVIKLAINALEDYNVVLLGEFGFRHPILFDFIKSGYGDFIEYIEEEL